MNTAWNANDVMYLGCLPSILGNFRSNVSGGSSSLPPHAGPAESLKSWGYKTVIYPLSFEYIGFMFNVSSKYCGSKCYPSYPSATDPGMYAAVFIGGVSRASSKKGVNANT